MGIHALLVIDLYVMVYCVVYVKMSKPETRVEWYKNWESKI